jgi:2-methylcitrate dehydratase PrpD
MKGANNKKPLIPGTPTRDLAEFASRLQYKDIPKAAIERAKTCVFDSLGNILYASTLPWCQILYQVIREEGGPSAVACWGQPERVSVTQAGLYNGTAGHGFELDDLHHLAGLHGGSAIIPASIAIAEHVGGGTGKELVTAIVAGYEVGARIGMAVMKDMFWRGYHAQGTIGPFAAAVSAGRMLKLDTDRMVHAMGMAGSHSSGLIAAQEGAMVKRLHSGHACQSGIQVALLARRGFTGITNILEAGFGGFCTTLGGDQTEPDKLTARLGEQWEILNIGFKLYPNAGSMHTVLDIAKDLVNKYGFKANDCEKVVAHTTSMTYTHCCFNYEPTGVTAAQMNLPFGLASLLRYGESFVDQYKEEAIRDPETMGFMRQHIQCEGRHAAWLEVFLKDGRRFSQREIHRKGSVQNPMSQEEVRDKFRRLASYVIADSRIDSIEKLVLNLDEVDDIRELTRLMVKDV